MKFAKSAIAVSVAAALLLLVAGPGTRLGLWEYGLGLTFLRWAFFIGLGGAGFGVLMLVMPQTRHGQVPVLVAAIIIGLGVAWVPWNGYQTARSLPFIHDVTTDTDNPPAFVDIAPLRADASNPVEYAGPETAALQKEGYPDLATTTFSRPPAEVFDNALRTARDMGWEIVSAVPEDGRIEATATTFWFGFKDDVVVRIEPAGSGARLDVRSKSRVGRSDVGANAARIRAYLELLAPTGV